MAGPPPIFLKIDQAMRAGDMAKAVSLSRRALDSGHADPVLYSVRSYWHENEGRYDAALADLNRAATLGPVSPQTLASMGRCLTLLGRAGEALPLLDQALALMPGLAPAHYQKGFALEQLGELRPARAAYEQALALDPAMADAAARLAALAARRSEWPLVRRLAETALAGDPHNAVAHFALVMLEMAEGDFSGAETRIRQVIAFPATTAQARAHGLNLLGDALDAQDRTAEAFVAYAAANDALHGLFKGRFEGSETGLPFARRMRRALEELPPWQSSASVEDTPVFILGFARAGNTLLGQILAAHPRFVTLEEKPLLIDGMKDFLAAKDGVARLADLSDGECDRYRRLFRQRAREQGGDGRILVDQTPLNTLHLALIARLFPGAPVVFALRDPRDVVLSCFRRLFVPNPYTFEFLSLERTAQFYDAAMACAELARAKLPLRFYDLRNERLVDDFTGEMTRLCAFLGVDYDPAMAGFAQRSRSQGVATPSATQIAKGLSREGIGQWRRYQDQLSPVLPLLAPWVSRFGY